MKKDNKKALYENIMTSVAKEVKKALNEKLEFTDDISKKVQWTSSSHQRVKPDDILNSEIIIWDEKSINSFNEKFYPMLEKIENNKKQIEILSKTRDQLLPKLMSWEVRVEF